MSWRGKGDRRFNDCHYSWPKEWDYIDLDGLEVCHRCRESLLLYEVTRNGDKATSILRRLAVRAQVPALLLLVPDGNEPFTDETPVSWKAVVGWDDWHEGSLADLRVQVVQVIRDEHDQDHCAMRRRQPA